MPAFADVTQKGIRFVVSFGKEFVKKNWKLSETE